MPGGGSRWRRSAAGFAGLRPAAVLKPGVLLFENAKCSCMDDFDISEQ